MKKTFLLLLLTFVFLLCGCVKVEPQVKEKEGLPVYGAECSIFDPINFSVEINGEQYVSAGDVSWSLGDSSFLYGWVDHGGKEEAQIWFSKVQQNDDVCQIAITLPNLMNIAPIYHKKDVDVPGINVDSVGAIMRRVDGVFSETDDRALIEELFHALGSGQERPQKHRGWGVDETVDPVSGEFYFVNGDYPQLKLSFKLSYDMEDQRYFLTYSLRRDMKPIPYKKDENGRTTYISDELAQKLMAI